VIYGNKEIKNMAIDPETQEELGKWQGVVEGLTSQIAALQTKLEAMPDNSPKITSLEELLTATQTKLATAEAALTALQTELAAMPKPPIKDRQEPTLEETPEQKAERERLEKSVAPTNPKPRPRWS